MYCGQKRKEALTGLLASLIACFIATDLVAVVPLPDGVQERGLSEIRNAHRVGHALQRLRVHRLQIRPLYPESTPHTTTKQQHTPPHAPRSSETTRDKTRQVRHAAQRQYTVVVATTILWYV